MKIFGLTISRANQSKAMSPVDDSRGWIRILEPFIGAWQKNVHVDFDCALSYHAVYACITLIASDIAKLRVKLVQQDANGIWIEVNNPAYSPVLRKPNEFQNRIQFWEYWILSKLTRGNAYILKRRDNRGVVTALYILDPCRVQVLVSDSGDVFYQLSNDPLNGIEQATITVPAREIIHDRMNCIYHPLVGTSPIFASGIAAVQGLAIQNNQARFFTNRSMPGGIITVPGAISDDTAKRLKASWEANYSGDKSGKVAVLGDNMKFEPVAMNAVDSQLIEQLKWSAETVCSTFHVPGWKIGVSPLPAYGNVQAANVDYFSRAVQYLIEAAELCLDDGLGMDANIGTEFDIDGLLRMDSVSQVASLKDAVGAAIMAPNEARKRLNYGPVAGGDAPLAQQQNYSLEALSKRDAKDDPFSANGGKSENVQPVPVLPPPEKRIDPSRVKTLFKKAA